MKELNQNDKNMLIWQLAFLGIATTCLGITLGHRSPADRIATFAVYPIAALAFGIKYKKYLNDYFSKQSKKLAEKNEVEKKQLELYKKELRDQGILSK